jgi:hypothetical protein
VSALSGLYSKSWVVYCKPPFGSPRQVLAYLARYTHRVAISNSRLARLEKETVTLTWKDYAQGERLREMTLSGEDAPSSRSPISNPCCRASPALTRGDVKSADKALCTLLGNWCLPRDRELRRDALLSHSSQLQCLSAQPWSEGVCTLARSFRYNRLHEIALRSPGMRQIPSMTGPLKASRLPSELGRVSRERPAED